MPLSSWQVIHSNNYTSLSSFLFFKMSPFLLFHPQKMGNQSWFPEKLSSSSVCFYFFPSNRFLHTPFWYLHSCWSSLLNLSVACVSSWINCSPAGYMLHHAALILLQSLSSLKTENVPNSSSICYNFFRL